MGTSVRAARALARLPRHSWTVLSDLRWPEPGHAEAHTGVDHVVVGPRGVFVVDYRDWPGPVEVRDGVLTCDGRPCEEAVLGVAEAAIAVAQQTRGVPVDLVQPVLCLLRDEPVSGRARDVLVCSTANLHEVLTTRPVQLSTHQVVQVCLDLHGAVMPWRGAWSAGFRPVRSGPAGRRPTPR